MRKINLGVLASGRGSNLQSIIDATERGEVDAEVRIVISNNSKAYALERARNHNIAAVHLSHKQFESGDAFDDALIEMLKKHGVELVVLAGYMKLISPKVCEAYRHRILNIHPALLPSFGGKGMYGMHVHEAVIESGAKISGLTVHIVDEQYDHGPIVLQKTVPVRDDDDPDSLAARILPEEHKMYPEAIQLFAEGKIRVEGRRVYTT
ncbi:MAG: phosphoribosylglycinamide formyltransferase [Gemmatimonadota bacterium]|nr:MAG: phosphoribosylglycinamide formyltransferase [Gemmatimonadota bacterium]